MRLVIVNTLRPRQNGRRFPDDIFKRLFLNENVWTSINISLKVVPMGPINNIPALVPIMAWHRQGDKPLSEPMMISLLTHICVTSMSYSHSSLAWVNPALSCHELHYSDVIMGAMASQITGVSIVYSTVCSGVDQRNYQGYTSLAFVKGNSPVTGEFPSQRASNTENVSIWWRHHEKA